jgi:hypothetical protein
MMQNSENKIKSLWKDSLNSDGQQYKQNEQQTMTLNTINGPQHIAFEIQVLDFSAISWGEQDNFQWDDDEVNLNSWIFIVLDHWNNCPTRTHYPDSESTSLCSFSLMLGA